MRGLQGAGVFAWQRGRTLDGPPWPAAGGSCLHPGAHVAHLRVLPADIIEGLDDAALPDPPRRAVDFAAILLRLGQRREAGTDSTCSVEP
jgi:hypothetical protein